jgi:transcriptional regulator with XRE-family HTH domain
MNLTVLVPEDLRIDPVALEEALHRAGVHASLLARRLRVDVGTVSRWRRGKADISHSRFLAILAVLGLPLDWEPTPGWKGPPADKKGRPRRSRASSGGTRTRR